MSGPAPALAAVRLAVRRELADLVAGDVVLVACSGGPDSLALAAGLAFEGSRAGLRAGALTVDHGLQSGSAEQAATVVRQAGELGLDPVEALWAPADPGGHPAGSGGPEAAARCVRYAALDLAAQRVGAAAVLLGHSRDDQAETVLLGLARGAGARSLSGMPPRRGRYRRPLLDLPREVLAAACAAAGLRPWQDPHNRDPAYARARLRTHALPALEEAVGPGVAEALARSARLLRADADALDTLAAEQRARVTAADGSLDVGQLGSLLPALRSRVLRLAAAAAGAPAGDLSAAHVDSLDALVTGWHGQRAVALPGGLAGLRRDGRLQLTRPVGRG